MVEEPFVAMEARSQAWPVAWSAVWVGALSALAVALVVGLLGFALGAHQDSATFDWRQVRGASVVFSMVGAFFSFVIGAGWPRGSGDSGGRRRRCSTGSSLCGWYGGLAWRVVPAEPVMAEAVRNAAVATATALLLGLGGSVLGGWMASGEPMSLVYYRRRGADVTSERPRRVA